VPLRLNTNNGEVYWIGEDNNFGQNKLFVNAFPNPATNEDVLLQYGGAAQNTPRKLVQPSGKTIIKTAAYATTSLTDAFLWALASDGTVWQWDRSNTTPFQVTGWGTSNNARNIGLGAYSKFIETTSNTLYGWGYRGDAIGAQASWQNPLHVHLMHD
jgi:hypothetical protein